LQKEIGTANPSEFLMAMDGLVAKINFKMPGFKPILRKKKGAEFLGFNDFIF